MHLVSLTNDVLYLLIICYNYFKKMSLKFFYIFELNKIHV